jgi:hypothetical protein
MVSAPDEASHLCDLLAGWAFEVDQAGDLTDTNTLAFDCRSELRRCGTEHELPSGLDAGADHWVLRQGLDIGGNERLHAPRRSAELRFPFVLTTRSRLRIR